MLLLLSKRVIRVRRQQLKERDTSRKRRSSQHHIPKLETPHRCAQQYQAPSCKVIVLSSFGMHLLYWRKKHWAALHSLCNLLSPVLQIHRIAELLYAFAVQEKEALGSIARPVQSAQLLPSPRQTGLACTDLPSGTTGKVSAEGTSGSNTSRPKRTVVLPLRLTDSEGEPVERKKQRRGQVERDSAAQVNSVPSGSNSIQPCLLR